jgi:hypothetical protein
MSTTNPTYLDPVFNPGRRGGKPATNRLSYDAALNSIYFSSGIQTTSYVAGKNCFSSGVKQTGSEADLSSLYGA